MGNEIIRVQDSKHVDPIRDHISMKFEIVEQQDQIDFILRDLNTKSFDKTKSRILVFTNSRKKTEQAVLELRDKLKPTDQLKRDEVDFYHAGLEGSEREERFEAFKSGDTLLLVATKAFGMGMDIPNIHYIYHLGPSSNFEDYLQEVGRAGRNARVLELAGFSSENPIATYCLITAQDFSLARERLREGNISWGNLEVFFEELKKYVLRFRTPLISEDKESIPFPLPLDLLEELPAFSEYKNKDSALRIMLYWLERLEKINLGVYVPSQIPIEICKKDLSASTEDSGNDRDGIKTLIDFLSINYESHEPEADELKMVMIGMNELLSKLDVPNFREVYRILFKAQKLGLIKVHREIKIHPTKLRSSELEIRKSIGFSRKSVTPPSLLAITELSRKILAQTRPNQQVAFNSEAINILVAETTEEVFNDLVIDWDVYQKSNELESGNKKTGRKKKKEILIDDFRNKRAKFAFKLINMLPLIRHKSIISQNNSGDHATVEQLVYNGYKSKKTWLEFLDNFEQDLVKLIDLVYHKYQVDDQERHNLVDLLNELGIDDPSYLSNLIFISGASGYLIGASTSVAPMGIELYFKNTDVFPKENLSGDLLQVYNDFEESIKFKKIRLLALECLSQIPELKQRLYINEYFKCQSYSAAIELLEEHLGDANESLMALREEALIKKKEELNEQQKAVYEAPINKNIEVKAGPGSGKTHTLTLRVARLIQEENIDPSNILILAYNRAVVVELKSRLSDLFRQLGYVQLIRRLKVFTFHGLCKYVLKDNLNEIPLSRWTQTFIKLYDSSPGLIRQQLGTIKHVLVDEFQDITEERLDLIKRIASPDIANICVIGDPNQSIYGYQRYEENTPMSPDHYYREFNQIYEPLNLILKTNYRSFQQIIDFSEAILPAESFKEAPKMTAHQKPEQHHDLIVEEIEVTTKDQWIASLHTLLSFEDSKGNKLAQIAIFFRSNAELFKAYGELKDINKGIRLRIQGANSNPLKSREFHQMGIYMESLSENESLPNLIQKTLKKLGDVLNEKVKWNGFHLELFGCLLIQYRLELNNDSTFDDLQEYLKELARRDEGQLGKIHQNFLHQLYADPSLTHTSKPEARTEVILTTMHKVKGLEFDAVIIPHSFSSLPFNARSLGPEGFANGEETFEEALSKIDDETIVEFLKEELRLYYVAYTRAKKKLITYKWKREHALLDDFKPIEVMSPKMQKEKLGIVFHEGREKLKLFWGASKYGENSYHYILENLEEGSPVLLKKEIRNNNAFWHVETPEGLKIAQLSAEKSKPLSQHSRLVGLYISSIQVHTYQETLDSETGKQYSDRWAEEPRRRGYIYLVDIVGYATPPHND